MLTPLIFDWMGLIVFGMLVIVLVLCRLWWAERKKAQLARQETVIVRVISDQRRRQLEVFCDIVEHQNGGVAKHIDEHERITASILKNAPHLLKADHNVVTWLYVSRAYFAALLAAVPVADE